jgi:phosphomannomutase
MSDYTPDFQRLAQRREEIDRDIFRAYDIRGDVEPHRRCEKPNLLPDDAYLIGRALGALFLEHASRTGGDPVEPRALVTGDHRLSTPGLTAGAACGLADAGLRVSRATEPVPSGATSRRALTDDLDIAVQVTGSHNPPYVNGLKIAVKKDDQGLPHPSGTPTPLYGNNGKRPFELIHLYEWIRGHAVEAPAAPGEVASLDGVVGQYVDDLAEHFRSVLAGPGGTFTRPFRVVLDPGNGLGCVAIPLLERLGVEIVPMFAELDGRFPNHPADPSLPEGVADAQEAVRERNRDGGDGPRYLGLVFDGDGDRCGIIDEEGEVVYPDQILLATYLRFLCENEEALRALAAIGERATLALDVRGSSVVREVVEEARDSRGLGVGADYIPAGYPYHRAFVLNELRRLEALIGEGRLEDTPAVRNLLATYTSAEASGHFFYATAPRSRHSNVVVDDGIFTAVKLLHILDTLDSHEAPLPFVDLPAAGPPYEVCHLFAALPWRPVSNDIRGDAPLDGAEKYAVVREIQEKVRAGAVPFRQAVARTVGMEQIEDGIRVEFEDRSSLLVRASNTSPMLTYKFEAPTRDRLVEVIEESLEMLGAYTGRGVTLSELEAERDRLKALPS